MTILNDLAEVASFNRQSAEKPTHCEYLKEKPRQDLSKREGLPLKVSAMAMPVGVRLGDIAKTAYADLVDLCCSERANYPKTARLFSATKRASRAISVEVVSLAMSYPGVAAAIAISFVAFHFVFNPTKEDR
jgi:hypothetical protein